METNPNPPGASPGEEPGREPPPEDETSRAILGALRRRGPGKTICPSEAAKELSRDEWRSWMPEVHAVVRDLRDSGAIMILQGGKPVTPDQVRGPYRIALAD